MTKSIDITRIAFGFEVVLIVGLAFLCSRLLWLIAWPGQPALPDAMAFGAPKDVSVASVWQPRDMSVLTSENPFSVQPLQKALNSAALSAPETSLNLKLLGVRANDDGEGVAFVLLSDNRQVRATVGDEILDGVILEYVFADRITLRTRGQLENLFRRKDEGLTGLVAVVEEARVSAVASGKMTPRDFLSHVAFTPVRESGVRTGYRLSAKGSSDVLLDAGLAPDDVIRSVNARAISQISNEDLYELFLQFSQLTLEVSRGNERIEVIVRFSEEPTK